VAEPPQLTEGPPDLQANATFTAISFGIASAFLFALSNVALRFAKGAGPLDIALIRSVAFAVALAPIALTHQPLPSSSRPTRMAVILGLFTATTISTAATWFLGLRALPLSTATSLFSLKATFSVLGAALFMRERLSARRLTSICVGFIGGAVLLNPGQPHLAGAALVLCAAASSAAGGIFYAQLVRAQSPTRILLISSLFQLLALAPFALVDSIALPPFTLAMATLSAVLSIGVMYTLAWAYRGADVGLVASLEYLRLPLAAGLAFLFFAERPTPAYFVGSAIIIVGATLVGPALERRSQTRQLKPQRLRLWGLR
jgi:drug/metabolite transporter (DMT)-like permease